MEVFPVMEAVDSAEVYSAVIQEAFSGRQIKKLYISTNSLSTENNDWWKPPGNFEEQESKLEELFFPADVETLRSFSLKHAEVAKIDPELIVSHERSIEFVDGDMVDLEIKAPVLNGNPSKLLGPVLRLSRIGFDSTRNQALVQMDYVGCPLCGFGSMFLLDKTSGRWIVFKQFSMWIS